MKKYIPWVLGAMVILATPAIGLIDDPVISPGLFLYMALTFVLAQLLLRFGVYLATGATWSPWNFDPTWGCDKETLTRFIRVLLFLSPLAILIVLVAPPAQFWTPLNLDELAVLWDQTVSDNAWLRYLAYGLGSLSTITAWRNYDESHRGDFAFFPAMLLFLAVFVIVAAWNSKEMVSDPRIAYPTAEDLQFQQTVEADSARAKLWARTVEVPWDMRFVNDLNGKEKDDYWRYHDAMVKISFHRNRPADYFQGYAIGYSLMVWLLMVLILHAVVIPEEPRR